jgi:2-oxoglutarate ferredoxin oxidoreductase subunit beta
MAKTPFDLECDMAWCPGCGNFGILNILKEVLDDFKPDPEKLVFVSGIGQAAKTPQYLKCHYFNGLHGRALPPAVAIKASNRELTVIVESGDGDMYGEGGNHFLHTIRRNPDITNFVHNNMVYGLTKGQASPTSERGFKTPVQVEGVILEPFNPLAVAIALDASFVARVFVGFRDHAKEILKKAILHKGYALVDIFQPCVTFNKINTYAWFREHTYLMDASHDPKDRSQAFRKAIETEKMPLGIFYLREDKPVFEEQIPTYKEDPTPLWKREVRAEAIARRIQKLKT